MAKFFTRSLIVIFWLIVVSLFLYLPTFSTNDPKSINIFTWGDILEPSVITEFEEKTGYKIRLNYYSSNEELMVKLKATQGKGYDLIIPSDYAVRILSKEGLLKPIDKTKLNFWNDLHPYLLEHFFDPSNTYSIPFGWEIYALGYNNQTFTKTFIPSWKMIFDKDLIDYKIAMINDPIEAVQFAAFYLYGPVDTLSESDASSVKSLLLEQRKWVEAYADSRGDYFLATKNCPVVIASSSYIQRSMKKFDFISLAIPEEGSFITIENLCIPKYSEKDEAVYKFINYLYRIESTKKQYETYGFFPAIRTLVPYLNLDKETRKLLLSTPKEFKKYHFFSTVIPEQEIRDIWLEVKTRSEQ